MTTGISSQFVTRPGAFRLILAMLVFLSHMSRFGTGRLAVMLFFVLSGYWISDLWQRETGRRRYAVFAANRLLRIWPLYIVAVLISYAIFAHPLDVPSITIFGVASAEGVRQLGVEWSLDIEAQFYVVAPLLIAARIGLWVVPLTALGWLIVSVTGVTSLFMYLPAFYAGIVMFRYRSQPLPVSPQASLGAFIALTAILMLHPYTRQMIQPIEGTGGLDDARDMLAMVWSLPLLPYIAASLRLKSSPLDRHLGNLAFPFYLIHEVLIQALRAQGWGKPMVAMACICAAFLLYVAVDLPIERFRHRLLGRFKRPASVVMPVAG